MLKVNPHPILDAALFVSEFERPLGEITSPEWVLKLLTLDADVPLRSDVAVRSAVRDLLRYGGFKPTGRSKPASEYLLRAIAEGALSSINLAVDACNVVSVHSGLPISVVDLDRVVLPLSVALAEVGASYVFNASGQSIDIGGLVCLFDAQGPCANAVKDSQRTKTCGDTRRTLSVVWGSRELGTRTMETATWYRKLLEQAGAKTKDVEVN